MIFHFKMLLTYKGMTTKHLKYKIYIHGNLACLRCNIFDSPQILTRPRKGVVP